MMLTQIGFALIRVADNSVAETWTAHESSPPARIFVGELDVHGAQPGDILGKYKLVPRFVDDPGPSAPWYPAMPIVVGCDGERIVETVSYSEAPDMRIVAELLKTECARRIYTIASDNAQKNMLANVVAGSVAGADLDTYRAGVAWIDAMQQACRGMIATADSSFRDDARWPELPDGVAALAARF